MKTLLFVSPTELGFSDRFVGPNSGPNERDENFKFTIKYDFRKWDGGAWAQGPEQETESDFITT